MPLYEYQCDVCGHRFEVIQKFSDAAIEICPQCGGQVHKLPSAPAIQFKGAGWYVTDYAKKGTDSSKSNSDNETKPSAPPASDSKSATEKSSPSIERPSASSTGPSSGSTDKPS